MEFLRETPWDKRNFNIDTYEVLSPTEEALKETNKYDGHYTIKVQPLENPELLLNHGFYYMDTLIEPECKKENLQVFNKEGISISNDYEPSEINRIAEEAFIHGRFHRDFNIPNNLADLRYRNWVKDLQEKNLIFALMYEGDTAGFFAYENDKVLLLGIKEEYRSRGLAKAYTSQGCAEQFKLGYSELRTSISAANVASLNLFYSLGFRLKNTVDVYHKLTGPGV
ncbi:GNAT family N-acetyltransferase [Virgibacillus doumboii]|uniref:GNAT family N-acetyltransferase n=1 Tax=Virgibacillus doumboii TaxID=2697503 RepID=UPI0013DF236F|nr:GNAT family N-acetyltransferase [Virgibacillus doumboii]